MLSSVIFSSNLFFLCLLVGLLSTIALYYSQRNLLKSPTLYFLSLIRFVSITFLCFLLLDPVVKSINKLKEEPIVVVLQDESSSIKEDLKDELIQFSNNIKGYNIFRYNFSDKLYDGFTNINDGYTTNYSKALTQVESIFSNRNLSSIVLISDGLNNTGANPLYSNNLDIPVHTLCLGDTNIYSDNLISEVKHNELVFLGNSFQTEILIQSTKYKGKKVNLTIENNGEKVFDKELNVTSNDQFFKISAEILTSEIGLQLFTAKLESLDGERNKKNNIYRFYVDVINTKYNILLVHDDSHPDLGAFVNVINRNKDYNLDVVKSIDFDNNFESYNLIVLHSISSENIDFVEKIKQKNNLPILLFCKQDFSRYSELIPNVDFKIKSTNSQVFPSTKKDFLKFKISNDLSDFIDNSPPITSPFGIYKISSSIDVFVNQKIGNSITNNPVCFFDEFNGQKIGVIVGEGFWRWKLQDYKINENDDLFSEFYNKITQYLLVREDRSKFRLFYEKELNENEDLIFEAHVYNDSYELENNEDIRLVLTNSNNKEFEYIFERISDKYILNVGSLNPDNYTVFAKVEKRNYEKFGELSIKTVQIENLSSVADHEFLYNLSETSGGKSFTFSNINELKDYINFQKDKSTITTTEDILKQLIDYELILLILLLLISFEWFIRKYNGLT